ncbi:ribonuclease D [Chitinivibrio alkaliphilus]|uniref:Ribonuclease D n=1 Tax=Chitinivibrio alkaliphilus ACht1 TaxID=1313304 RepID=U7D7I8_9BACT|nr:HRDC domain-containing protein [Chitinivibrio alkaliphilus]ERP38920.1 Ribonuclease D [Chitinivibrio alkaliphilus ACht1]
MTKYINDDASLEQMCRLLLSHKRIAVDTEFIWTKTYFPLLGIIQIGTEDETFVVDYPAITSWEPFAEVLQKKSVCKIFHDAPQDISILKEYVSPDITGIFDTQRAGAMLGEGEAVSLENLVAAYTGIRLAKTETRTDWLKRPLDPAQLAYARDDVKYLVSITEQLLSRAHDHGIETWVYNEMESLEDVYLFAYESNVERQFLKQASRLAPRYHERLYRLISFMENTARKENVTRTRVLRRQIIPRLVKGWFSSLEELRKSKILSPRMTNRYGSDIITALHGDTPRLPAEMKEHLRSITKRTARESSLSRLLLTLITDLAQRKEIAPSLVCTKRECDMRAARYYRKGEIPLFSGWRGDFLNPFLHDFFTYGREEGFTEKTVSTTVSAGGSHAKTL